MSKDLTALIIMDGYGLAPDESCNAVSRANKPNLDRLFSKYPNTAIKCYGLNVGLPEGQMGNSEVGHLNLGAGRIIYQPLTRISKAIKDGDFFENPAFLGAIDNVKKNKSALHLMGLVSDGGVHSHMDHILGLLRLAKKSGVKDVFIHCFMDGRDVPPKSGLGFIKELEENIRKIGVGKVAGISGRFYAMDRDNIWDRVEKAYDALVMGEGNRHSSAVEIMQASYDNDVTDEFVVPAIVVENGRPVALIKENDSVIFFNFRPDRARQLTRAFIEPEFSAFTRKKGYFPVYFVSLTNYDSEFKNIHVAYEPEEYSNTLGEFLSKNNIPQLRIAETQKYAHVTYFFNGGIEEPNPLEDRILIDSPKIETFDQKPEMSAYEVTDEVVKQIDSGKYRAIIMNYANCDMVGHTGIMQAAVDAVEAVDACVGRVVQAVLKQGGRLIITADHGNAEKMFDCETGEPYTAHTVDNAVPLILVDDRFTGSKLRNDGILADVAPTFLDIMGLQKPAEMTGSTLILR